MRNQRFTIYSAMAAFVCLVGLAVTLIGCGGNDSSTTTIIRETPVTTTSGTTTTAGTTTGSGTTTASSSTGTTSSNIPGAPTSMQFTVEPPATAEINTSIHVQVALLDASGNISHSTLAVTVQLGKNLAGAFLTGTNKVQAVNGVADFPDLRVSLTGDDFTFVATAEGLPSVESTRFNVVPIP